jgi:hypothetical protein
MRFIDSPHFILLASISAVLLPIESAASLASSPERSSNG